MDNPTQVDETTTQEQENTSPTPTPKPQTPEKPTPEPRADDQLIRTLRDECAERRVQNRELRSTIDELSAERDTYKTQLEAIQREKDLLTVATKHGITEEYLDFLGSGSQEEMEARAVKLETLLASQQRGTPPRNRPVEGMKPGASTPADEPSDAYPAEWALR